MSFFAADYCLNKHKSRYRKPKHKMLHVIVDAHTCKRICTITLYGHYMHKKAYVRMLWMWRLQKSHMRHGGVYYWSLANCPPMSSPARRSVYCLFKRSRLQCRAIQYMASSPTSLFMRMRKHGCNMRKQMA